MPNDKKVNVTLDEVSKALDRAGGGGGFESLRNSGDPEDEEFLSKVESWQAELATSPDRDNPFGSIDHEGVSLMQAFLARDGQMHRGRIEERGDFFEAKFDSADPGWVWSLRDWLKGLKDEPFRQAPAEPENIGSDYRIAVLSDWGTGLYGAPVCAERIERDVRRIDLMLHLGDVYYAGDVDEIKARFLAYWPKRADAISRALNGNHEMYSGGAGYFVHILPEFKQAASYFALHNNDWLLVALDTAYAKHALYGEQAQWLTTLAIAHPSQRIILFSHHQPFSYFESNGPKLVQALSPLLTSGRIAAWYWGHEHSCTKYDLHPQWKMYGRCVGHSGFPYFRRNAESTKTQWLTYPARGAIPACQVLDGPNPYVKPDSQRYGPNGYIMLELHGAKVHETYHDPDGTVRMEFDL